MSLWEAPPLPRLRPCPPAAEPGNRGRARIRARDLIDYDWMNPMDNLEAYFKLTNSLKDRDWVQGWYSGLVFGMLPNNTPDALFGLEGFGLGYTVRQEERRLRELLEGSGLLQGPQDQRDHRDLGEPLHRGNQQGHAHPQPHGQGRIRAQVPLPGAGRRPDRPKCSSSSPTTGRPTTPSNPFVLNWQTIGDQTSVWLDFRGDGTQPARPRSVGAGVHRRNRLPVCEMFEYVCNADDLRNPSLDRVKAQRLLDPPGPVAAVADDGPARRPSVLSLHDEGPGEP